jgi:hypothetical protein
VFVQQVFARECLAQGYNQYISDCPSANVVQTLDNNNTIINALDVYFYNQNISRFITFNYSGGINSITNTSGTTNSSTSFYNNSGFSGVTYTSATAVPFDFNPAEGAALGIPLFIGLGMLRKRATKKVAAQKVAELVS